MAPALALTPALWDPAILPDLQGNTGRPLGGDRSPCELGSDPGRHRSGHHRRSGCHLPGPSGSCRSTCQQRWISTPTRKEKNLGRHQQTRRRLPAVIPRRPRPAKLRRRKRLLSLTCLNGRHTREIDLSEPFPGLEPNVSVMHDVAEEPLSNCRQVPSRPDPRGGLGGGRKPWRQKGSRPFSAVFHPGSPVTHPRVSPPAPLYVDPEQ